MRCHATSRIMYAKIKPYLWKFPSGDGMDMMVVLKDVLALFETGAAEGKHAWTSPVRMWRRSATNACAALPCIRTGPGAGVTGRDVTLC